jgi:hypothetical protein
MKILENKVTDVETYNKCVITYAEVKTLVNSCYMTVSGNENRRALNLETSKLVTRNRSGYQYRVQNTPYTIGYFSTLDEVKTIIDDRRW